MSGPRRRAPRRASRRDAAARPFGHDGLTADYIVVGAGSAGAALAARLTEDPAVSVLLLEAGGPDTKPELHVPAAFSTLFRSAYDWNYDTVPQPELEGRTVYWPRGKTLGGSSSLNAMIWVRGFAADYDEWAETAGERWSWRSLVPYFRRVERTEDPADPTQGTEGAQSVERQRDPRPHTAAFLEAAREAGYPVTPANLPEGQGFSQIMVSQRRGGRASTADAYLRPARRRRNLRIVTGAHVRRVTFDASSRFAVPDASSRSAVPDASSRSAVPERGAQRRDEGRSATGKGSATGVDPVTDASSRSARSATGNPRATGVYVEIGGVRRHALARREVILCGGSINTPQLLMLSGIGPAAHLAEHGIPVVVDIPAVGENLQDHLVAGLAPQAKGGTLFDARRPAQLARYLSSRRGMLTSNVGEGCGFVRTEVADRTGAPDALPDIEILFAPVPYIGEGLVPTPEHGLTVGAILLRPRSRGTIRLASADPAAKPIIDPRYLSDPDGIDAETLLAGLAVCERLIATEALGAVMTGRWVLPENGHELTADQRAELALRRYSHTLYHPVGTARMGEDDDSVVDPELRVRGVAGLRVADASVMPTVIRGHTNAPSIVIGEVAADLIRGTA